MADPLISICIPTFNGEKYLRECLDSCITQDFQDYEIVICDDGSTDATKKIIEEYEKKDSRIRFFKNDKNLGLVGNWNRCIEMAGGEWIKFVFQDDYITRNCLRKFAEQIEPSSVLMVCERNFVLPQDPSVAAINYYTQVVRTLRNTTHYSGTDYSPRLLSVIAIKNMCMNFIGEPSLIFFRKSIVNEVGYVNNYLKQICDLEFALRIGTKYGLKYVPEKLCSFRIHEDSTTTFNLENKFFELKYIEPLLYSYFLLYDKNYQDFRSYLGVFQFLKLKLYFKLKAYQANQINMKEKRGYYLFGESRPFFKEIIRNKNGSFLIKCLALLKK
jgi:glycosyltransferase involved in cell wall biosynthesis